MRVILFVGSVLALALAGYLAITGYFLARSATGILTVGAVSAALLQQEAPAGPLSPGFRGNPMDALGLPFRVVPVATPLGPAEAWLVPAAGAEAGRAIYVHGIAGAREDGYRHLAVLHDAGWSVLLIGYRNDPGAPATQDGRYGLGLTEWPDLEAAVDRFAPGPDGPGLLVVADSMGGAILGQFLARSDRADRVAAVALDSPAVSFAALTRHLAAGSGNPLPGALAAVAGLMLPAMTGLPLAEAEVAATFIAFDGPLFIAHGAEDRIVPIGPSRALAAARAGPTVTHWTEADHLASHAADPATYRRAFEGFLATIRP